MSAKPEKHNFLEIVISTYWPTRIIKSIQLKDPNKESSFNNNITLTHEQAEYLYNQLDLIYGPKDGDINHV